MRKKMSRMIAAIMLVAAIGFIAFAFGHPEMSFPWSNTVTHVLYVLYILATVVLFAAPF